MEPSQRRIAELDALRGLAALAVVLYHFTTRYDQLFGHSTPLPASFAWGEYGVDFFLMLSGFVILRSLDRTPRAGEFIASRFVRLYPAYWAAAAVTFCVVCIFGLSGQQVAPWEAALNATMLQQTLGARHIDGAYWSLQVELFFYAGMLALYRAGAFRNSRRLQATLALWLVLEAVSTWMLREGGDIDRTIVARIVGKLQVLLSLRYAHLFAIGIVLYHRSGRRAQPADRLLLAGCWILQGIVDSWPAALLIAALTFVLHGAAIGRLGALAARPLVLLGSISYPLYLIHQNVGYVVIRELELRRLSPTVAIASSLAVVLALAWGLSFAIERPAQNWIKRRRQSRRAPKPPLVPPERVISIRGRAAYVRLTGHYLSD